MQCSYFLLIVTVSMIFLILHHLIGDNTWPLCFSHVRPVIAWGSICCSGFFLHPKIVPLGFRLLYIILPCCSGKSIRGKLMWENITFRTAEKYEEGEWGWWDFSAGCWMGEQPPSMSECQEVNKTCFHIILQTFLQPLFDYSWGNLCIS